MGEFVKRVVCLTICTHVSKIQRVMQGMEPSGNKELKLEERESGDRCVLTSCVILCRERRMPKGMCLEKKGRSRPRKPLALNI